MKPAGRPAATAGHWHATVHLLEGVAALLSAEDHTTVPNDLRDRLRELVQTIRSRIEPNE